MKASKLIEELQKITAEFGDLEIIGGMLSDDTPLRTVSVLEKNGGEIYPHNVNGLSKDKIKVDGIWFSH